MKAKVTLLPHEPKERGWINKLSKIYNWSDFLYHIQTFASDISYL